MSVLLIRNFIILFIIVKSKDKNLQQWRFVLEMLKLNDHHQDSKLDLLQVNDYYTEAPGQYLKMALD